MMHIKNGLLLLRPRGWKSSAGSLIISSVIFTAQVPSSSSIAFAAADESEKGDKGSSAKDFFQKITASIEGKKLPFGDGGLPVNFDAILNAGAEKLKVAVESGIPSQLGYGFLMGYSSGFCLKKVSKIIAFGLGSVFIIIQTLSYNGYIKVDYGGVQKDIEKMLDINKDGKVDQADAVEAFDKVRDVLEYNMPSGGGFAAGLAMGLRG